jgi:transcriptional regulator with XRE-family HTH domain
MLTGQDLKKIRVSIGLSQDHVSKILGYTNSQFISNIERDLALIPDKQLPAYATILEVNLKDLSDAKKKKLSETVDKKVELAVKSLNINKINRLKAKYKNKAI